jgi:peptidoglycan/xylan/chitin deacetylase (PgdA/CDA1 family)
MSRAVLTFHAIEPNRDVLSYAPDEFAMLIEGLLHCGVPILSFAQLLGASSGVTLTFDDGMQSVRESALPVIRAHNVPAHLFLTTAAVGKTNRWPSQPASAVQRSMLTWKQIEECAAGGMLIESHTHTHPDLRALTDSNIQAECAAADEEIERRIGRAPIYFAYPYGWFDPRVERVVADRYSACFTTRLGYMRRDTSHSSVPRLDTYYLRAPIFRDHVLSPWMSPYVGCRALLRRLRGTQ